MARTRASRSRPPVAVQEALPARPAAPRRWFIRNQHGVIHEVTAAHYRELILQDGFTHAENPDDV